MRGVFRTLSNIYDGLFLQKPLSQMFDWHYVKSVRIRSYSGPYFPAFALNTERYGVSLCIQSECGKMRTRITPNTDTFYTLWVLNKTE